MCFRTNSSEFHGSQFPPESEIITPIPLLYLMNTIDAFVEEAESKEFYLEVERNYGEESSWIVSYVTGLFCQLGFLGGVKKG